MSATAQRAVDGGKRPESYPYAFSALRSLPRRLMNPPSAGVEKCSSFRISPAFKVQLDDVLNGKHLPPLGLPEFQDYLMYTEYSVENLQFFRWLRDYSTCYTTYRLAAIKDAKLAQKLHTSFIRAKATFLTAGASYELNIPSITLNAFKANLSHVERATPPPPDVFAEVRHQVEIMLKESLVRFVSANCGNAGRNRGLFAITVGILTICVGLVPILLSFLPATASNYSRWVRASALAPFWLGLSTLLAGLHNVCVIIYLFGDARQLYPYELARPTISAPTPLPASALVSQDVASPSGVTLPMVTLNKNIETKFKVESTNGSIPEADVDDGASDKGTYPDTGDKVSFVLDFDAIIPPYTAGNNGFGLGREKSSTGSLHSRSTSLDSNPSSRAMWSPLTKVISPIVSRAQWEIFTRSMLSGFLFGLAMCIILIPL